MAPSSPIGIELYRGKTPKWRVGKQLGSGACATVHLLEEIDGSPTQWAIKLAPVPKKKTKKGTSTEEVNDRLLYNEGVMYQNQFQDIQGRYVPKLPPYGGPLATGEAEGTIWTCCSCCGDACLLFALIVEEEGYSSRLKYSTLGYRYLIMEKMQSPLFDIVPALLQHSKSSTTIDFGPIAVQLLKCVQAIQERKHVVVDVKPDNFMLAPGAGKGSGAVAKLSSRIRILDLAMVEPWASIGSHRTNDGTSGLTGTPMYASLHIHNGETASRRDDLEALGFVMAELIMKIASGNASMELPWSDGASDEAIGQMKSNLVNNVNSSFYKHLGGPAVVKIIKKYIDTVHGYTFKQVPDYDQLVKLVSAIKIPTPKAPTPRKTSKKAAAVSKATFTPAPTDSKRVTRSRARGSGSADEEESSPRKMARDDNYMETEVAKIDEDPVSSAQPFAATPLCDDSFETAVMDWEALPDENEDPEPDQKPEAVFGVTLVVDAGPEKGTAVNLVQGRCETIVIGRKPVVKGGEVALELARDKDVDDSHIRMDLSITKKLIGVVVTDLNSSNGSYIGSEKIRSGKDWKIFRGDTVRIGNSVLRVKNLDAGKVATEQQKQNASTSTNRNAAPKRGSPIIEEMQVASLAPALQRRGVRLCVVEGPHAGEEYELEHGVAESFNVGSKPTGTGQMITLSKDKTLKNTHIRVELFNHKKLKAVIITDKSKGGTKVNRDDVQKGRAFINDQIKIGESVLLIKAL